jgi:hypothetical protein
VTPRSRRKKSKLFSKKPSKRIKGKSKQGAVINSAIAVLSLFLIAFIFSFSQRTAQNGVSINVTFPALPEPKTPLEIYVPPVQDIEIEVLNGCGKSGLANKLSDYLRENKIDVVRSENAEHFDYTETLVILRNEQQSHLKKVVETLGLGLDDPRVKIQPDESSDVSITLIIGGDFSSLEPFLNNSDTAF